MKSPIYYRRFNYDRNLLPNVHLASLEQGVQDLETAEARSGATIGYPGWGVIYHVLLAHLDPAREQTLIETGANWGCSTIVMAQALVDAGCPGKVVTFELDSANGQRARQQVALAGLSSRVELHIGDSRTLLPRVLDGIGEVRFAFLDASHLMNDVLTEFETLLPKLTDDALVLFDNTYCIASEGEDQRVNGALKAITARHGGNLINLEFVSWYTPGLALWQKAPKL